MNTMLHIPFGPGALYGDSRVIDRSTCSSVMLVKLQTGSGYSFTGVLKGWLEAGLKKALYRSSLFSWFVWSLGGGYWC